MSVVIEQRIATLLGNLGLVPLFVLALAAWPWSGPVNARIELALAAYTAVILSFLGAVHWGLALVNPGLNKEQSWNAFGWGVIPSLLGWLAVLMMLLSVPSAVVFAFLIGDLLLARVMDGALMRLYSTIPAPWYLALRTRLTIAASACLLIAVFAALAR
jgi:hypothetical protein